MSKVQINYNLFGGESHKECADEIISKTMHDFKKGDLKGRDDKVIKNKDQAIAIGLSQVENKCEYNKDDMKKLLDKVNSDLNDDAKPLILSNLIETKQAIEHLIKDKKSKRAYVFKKLLWQKVINAHVKGGSLEKNFWDELKDINKMV